MRIVVRIDTPEDEVSFQNYLFRKGWGWTAKKIKNIRHQFVIGKKLLYYLYTNEEGFYYSNIVTPDDDDYIHSISITEAKVKLFYSDFPTFIEMNDE